MTTAWNRREVLVLAARSMRERRALVFTLTSVIGHVAYGPRSLIAGAWILWIELARRLASIETATLHDVYPFLRGVV